MKYDVDQSLILYVKISDSKSNKMTSALLANLNAFLYSLSREPMKSVVP